jgi:magnesium chelatase subunit D
MLTDGRANVARDGMGGREQAETDARASARMLRGAGLASLVIDISRQPHPSAEQLAADMGARYLPLPNADARTLSRAVQAVTAQTAAA